VKRPHPAEPPAPDVAAPSDNEAPDSLALDRAPSAVDPVGLGLVIAQLAETDPHHELLIAARLALTVADARRADRRALRESALEVHAGRTPGQWRRWAERHVPFEELQRRRGLERGPDHQWRTADPTTGDAA
jgi:hypothetical protein